ncbi:50S ribosomal protein L17, partial [candidate division WWE3 bacterium]|nr:50S ribosomal protein L17 [candidate division WWE3 bacterium]
MKLNMDTDHRNALNRYIATSFVEKGNLTTTLAKANFVKPYIEKLVTLAKRNNAVAKRRLQSLV